ncbi:ABC-2 transporter permease [Actinotignum sp. GS-2025a]|uniref:ABC-2 transporter permease n=1 Tax=Actinotignum sp. GS-2025a TaxID=3427274 RepID=UPI003F44E972
MRAAFYKDLIANRTNLIVLGLVTAAMTGLGVYANQLIIFPFIFGMIGMLYFTGTFARDSESKVNRTILAGPTARSKLVNLNYLITAILGVVAFAVTGFIASLMTEMPWRDTVLVASFAFAATLLLVIIQLPLFYKYGPERARLFLVAVFIVAFAGSSFIGSNKKVIFNWIAKALTWPPLADAGVLLAVSLALTTASLWLSRKIVAGQEF